MKSHYSGKITELTQKFQKKITPLQKEHDSLINARRIEAAKPHWEMTDCNKIISQLRAYGEQDDFGGLWMLLPHKGSICYYPAAKAISLNTDLVSCTVFYQEPQNFVGNGINGIYAFCQEDSVLKKAYPQIDSIFNYFAGTMPTLPVSIWNVKDDSSTVQIVRLIHQMQAQSKYHIKKGQYELKLDSSTYSCPKGAMYYLDYFDYKSKIEYYLKIDSRRLLTKDAGYDIYHYDPKKKDWNYYKAYCPLTEDIVSIVVKNKWF